MKNLQLPNGFWVEFGKAQVELLKKLVGEMVEPGLQHDVLILTLKPITDIFEALVDIDPNNKEQIKQIIKDHTAQNVVPFASKEFNEKVLVKIKDDKLRALIAVLSQVPFSVAQIFTDDNTANETQLKTYLESWAEDGENQDVILEDVVEPMLKRLFKKSPFIATWLIGTIKMQLASMNIDIDGDGK